MQKNHLIDRIKKLSTPVAPEKVGHQIQLKPIDGIKCIAFDFYGTMFISADGKLKTHESRKEGDRRFFREALAACEFEITDKKAGIKGLKKFNEVFKRYINEMEGQNIAHPEPDIRAVTYDILTALKNEDVINGKTTENRATLFVIEFGFRSNAMWPLPHLLKTLCGLKQNGYKLGIISNSQFYSPLTFEALTDIRMDNSCFAPDLKIWSSRHGIKKPALSFFNLFIDKLSKYNIEPSQVLYVGNDLYNDIVPAKRLGMKTALFVGDKYSIRHDKDDLTEKTMPDIIIDELLQLEECLS